MLGQVLLALGQGLWGGLCPQGQASLHSQCGQWPRQVQGSETLLPAQPCHLVVDVQLVVLPGLQGLVQVQVTLHCVVLEDVAPA